MKYQDRPMTFVIDGYWWSRSRGAVTTPQGMPTFVDNPEGDYNLFWSKLSTDLAAEVKVLGESIEHIVIVSDKQSWRKDYKYIKAPWEKEEDHKEDQYKAGRTYDKEVDWKAFHSCYFDWCNHLQEKFSVDHYVVKGAEGDDLIAFLGKHLIAQGRNMMYMSADKDLIQNVKVSDTGAMSLYYNRKAGNKNNRYTSSRVLYQDPHAAKMLDALAAGNKRNDDIFSYSTVDANNPYSHLLNNVISERIDERPISFVFYRIILGDAGDGIPPLFDRGERKKPRWPQIGDIYNLLKERYGITDENPITRSALYDQMFIEDFVTEYHKIHMRQDFPSKEHRTYYLNRFYENRKLGFLDENEIPADVWSAMANAVTADQAARLDNIGLSNLSVLTNRDEIMLANNQISNDSYFKQFEDAILEQIKPPTE